MKNNLQFGETVSGYNIPVVNEREIRATAGIMFLATLISFFLIIHNHDFVPIKYVIITVSYTHLDVYKRQTLYRKNLFK